MKPLTFSEFFALPPGVIFGQDYALPHRDPGLWRKGKSWEPYEDPDEDDSDDGEPAGVEIVDMLCPDIEATELIYAHNLEDDHRFLVYEAGDLGRLAGIIENARKVVV